MGPTWDSYSHLRSNKVPCSIYVHDGMAERRVAQSMAISYLRYIGLSYNVCTLQLYAKGQIASRQFMPLGHTIFHRVPLHITLSYYYHFRVLFQSTLKSIPRSRSSRVYTIDLARPTIDSPTFRRLDRLGSDDDRLRRLGLYVVYWPKLLTTVTFLYSRT